MLTDKTVECIMKLTTKQHTDTRPVCVNDVMEVHRYE